jgi:hypothetical protein
VRFVEREDTQEGEIRTEKEKEKEKEKEGV